MYSYDIFSHLDSRLAISSFITKAIDRWAVRHTLVGPAKGSNAHHVEYDQSGMLFSRMIEIDMKTTQLAKSFRSRYVM